MEVNDGITTMDAARDPAYVESITQAYEKNKSGPLAEGSVHTFAYQPLQLLDTNEESGTLESLIDKEEHSTAYPDKILPSQEVQFAFIRRAIMDPNEATATIYLARKQHHFDKPDPKAIHAEGNYITLVAMLSYPFSRGNVHIQSANANDKPKIDFKHLSHPLDAEVLARHICSFEQLAQCEPLASCIKPGRERLPESFPNMTRSTTEAIAALRACAGTNYHPACTCAMMSEELGGVVNDRLVVYGTRNVRVCDASILPLIPRGNILSTVYAIAEKGADIIKEDLLRPIKTSA